MLKHYLRTFYRPLLKLFAKELTSASLYEKDHFMVTYCISAQDSQTYQESQQFKNIKIQRKITVGRLKNKIIKKIKNKEIKQRSYSS